MGSHSGNCDLLSLYLPQPLAGSGAGWKGSKPLSGNSSFSAGLLPFRAAPLCPAELFRAGCTPELFHSLDFHLIFFLKSFPSLLIHKIIYRYLNGRQSYYQFSPHLLCYWTLKDLWFLVENNYIFSLTSN